ncbi:alpha/beta hydrolase [Bradyrhizobium sp. WYCCWR 13023]|uniref:Alpha/beta hydrolase n=1 Tax=Bradyrhizobium zhengyangense TaxID=2911009 RepID=A0A9X1RFD1_9BRAD|nr:MULTISPECIES: alpha/beta hydrolase [Bradyrhizobium]MCG2630926.1 alpha/beta hydrolase [Bradyrhizobium zhengyangense]MCG2644545.1 alpha/beta hydrolase [Bradyrhizobium zhengyangense]MCG2672145.1 alpha/beta hydrolase [Bradyrhizobium zhengyangense]
MRADRTKASGARGRALRIALISGLVPLSLTLVQCGQSPNPTALAASSQANVQVVAKTNPQAATRQVASGDTFEDRFPAPQFKERFPSASESFLQRQMSDFSPKRAVQQQPEQAPYKVASLAPQVPYQRPPRQDLTTLVSMKSSAFPYFGNNPASDAPFLNISKGDRRGHRSYSGRVFWQDETYNDSRVLVHVPEHFDVRKPGVIVVFFHGNGATLERDVRDRQLVPQQITDSGANAVLLAPQMAVDAADSSAGKFWQPGGLKRFMEESANHLAQLTGDPNSARAFANMPIVIVGYSGGFLPTAWSLEVGGISDRVRGVVLLDAVYGEMDKFASWIESHRSGFFVSSYTHYTARRDRELMSALRQKGIGVSEDMDGPLRPGSVVFVETGEGITHRDYVNRAWTQYPLKDVLVKMSATPALALTRVAATSSSASSR